MASKINADEFVDREGENKPTLPKGVVLSGVTTITTAVVAENEVANSTGINAGIITSTHFKGNLTGDVNAGIVTVTSQSVIGSAVTISASGIDIGAGVMTATSYAGSGANLTGVGATIMVWEYNPDPSDMSVPVASGIGITFNQQIKAGSGNITLRETNGSGTVVENFGIGSSVTISNNELTITPTSDLSDGQLYHLSYPSGVITNMAGENYVGTAYTFQAIGYNYNLFGWGNNEEGQLGLNTAGDDRSSPTQIPGTTWAYGSNLHDYYIFSKTDGTLWAWGENENGVLAAGLAHDAHRSSPVQIPGTTWASDSYDKIMSGNGTTWAIKTDGTLWSWGNNQVGQLGHNNRTQYSSPVQIPGTTWTSISSGNYAGSQSTFGVKSDGTAWAWGSTGYGGLGLNQGGATPGAVKYSSPVQLPGTTWDKIVQSSGETLAIGHKTDGTLWAWGTNGVGRMGINSPSPTARSSPVQIPGTTWSKKFSLNMSVVGAVKTDGTLWMWGQNNGGLGQNDMAPRSSPIQVPGTTWKNVNTTSYFGSALKTDGTLWSWGYNHSGQLGQNVSSAPGVENQTSSPTQIGTDTDWDRLYQALGSMSALKKTEY
jgi:alpha-tubulin suppressor-like RCC1 family protein